MQQLDQDPLGSVCVALRSTAIVLNSCKLHRIMMGTLFALHVWLIACHVMTV